MPIKQKIPKFTLKECSKHGTTEYVLEGRGFYRCKKCRSQAVVNARRRRKQKLIEVFGGKCEKCGYNNCVAALHFHHIDPKTKKFGIADFGVCRSWDRMLEEAKKCQLLCSNCHAEIEYLPDGVMVAPDSLKVVV